MIEQRMKADGTMVPTFVLPPLATMTGIYPATVLGCKLTPLGLAAPK